MGVVYARIDLKTEQHCTIHEFSGRDSSSIAQASQKKSFLWIKQFRTGHLYFLAIEEPRNSARMIGDCCLRAWRGPLRSPAAQSMYPGRLTSRRPGLTEEWWVRDLRRREEATGLVCPETAAASYGCRMSDCSANPRRGRRPCRCCRRPHRWEGN